jgi:hypothetical protein
MSEVLSRFPDSFRLGVDLYPDLYPTKLCRSDRIREGLEADELKRERFGREDVKGLF